jgi:signal recognition particle GTPase
MFQNLFQKILSAKKVDIKLCRDSIKTELKNEGVLPQIIDDIIIKINSKLTNKKTDFFSSNQATNTIENAFRETLINIFGTDEQHMTLDLHSKNRILIIGDYGVGKTSLSAKLANLYSLINYKVSVGTIDKSRHGSQNQLKELIGKTDAEFIEIENFDRKNSTEILKEIELVSNDSDILIIDCFAIGDEANQSLLKEVVNLYDFSEILFAVDSIHDSLSSDLVINLYRNQQIQATGLCFTKFDGSINIGNIINSRVLSLKPIYFYCDGESMNDIHLFNPTNFINSTIDLLFANIQIANPNKVRIESFQDFGNYFTNHSNPIISQYAVDMICDRMTNEELYSPIKLSYDKKLELCNISGLDISILNKLIMKFENIKVIPTDQSHLSYNSLIQE